MFEIKPYWQNYIDGAGSMGAQAALMSRTLQRET